SLADMMEKAVARMDRIYIDALAAGTLRTDTYLVLEKPVERKDLPIDENDAGEALPSETDSSVTTAAPVGVSSFTVQYSSPDVESVSATERAVSAVTGVQSASTTSLARGGTSVMRGSFRGDLAGLEAALSARGFKVQEGRGPVRVRRGGWQRAPREVRLRCRSIGARAAVMTVRSSSAPAMPMRSAIFNMSRHGRFAPPS